MADQTITIPRLVLTPQFHAPTIGQRTTFDGTDSVDVRVVDIHGRVHETLELASCEQIVRTINQPDDFDVMFPKYAYTRDDVHVFADDSGTGVLHELQVYEGGNLLAWGPAVAADASSDDGAVHLHCKGVDWYGVRRAIDGARPNYLDNAEFEDDLDDWAATASITASVTTTRHILGSQAAQLVNAGADTDRYIYQRFRNEPNGIGTGLYAVAWFYVDTITAAAAGSRGLYIQAGPGLTAAVTDFYAIDTATPTKQWVRATAQIIVPPDTIWDVEVRLYAPQGTIVWDAVQVVEPKSASTAGLTGTVDGEVDVAKIVRLITQHIQKESVGKSRLNISTDTPDTGVRQAKHIQWADHIQWDQQMHEWLDRDDCMDYSVQLTPKTRVLTVHPGRQGTDKSGAHDPPDAFHFQYGTDNELGNEIAKHSFNEDGTSVITRATTMSDEDGPDREEGEYANAVPVGGLILQDIRPAPPKARLDSLLPRSRELVAGNKRPPKLPTITVVDTQNVGYAHLLEKGDLISVTIDDGWVQVDGVFRIVVWRYTPRSRTLELTLNEEE